MKNSRKTYKILFKGAILPGFDKTQVVANIHKLTTIPVNIITRKFFSGKTVVIRHTDDKKYAEQLKHSFIKAGIETTIKEIDQNGSDAINQMVTELLDHTTDENSPSTTKTIYIVFPIIILIIILSIFIFPTSIDNSFLLQIKKDLSIASPTEDKAKNDIQTVKVIDASTSANKINNDKLIQIPEMKKDVVKIDEKKLFNKQNNQENKIDSLSQEPLHKTSVITGNTDQEFVSDISFQDNKGTIETHNLTEKKLSLKHSEYKNFDGYFYGNIPFNTSKNRIISTLKEENLNFKDYAEKKTIKVLSLKDNLEIINKSEDNTLELSKIGDIYFISNENDIMSISLDSTFLFTDRPYIQGSYNLRVFPLIKQRFNLFLNKIVGAFDNKENTWWNNHIEPLKGGKQAETIKITGIKYTIIIKFTPKVSQFSAFSLTDYANRPIYNDRLSVTIVRTLL